MSRLHEHCPGLSAAEQEWLRRQLLKRAALTFERAGATSEAADCLRRLGATNAAADLLSRAGDLAAAAQTLVEGKHYTEACVCFRVWEERLDAADLVGRTRALLGQAACHLLSGERPESRAVYQRARATLMAAAGGVMEAACWAALAEYGTRVGRFDLIHEGYERALLLGHPATTLVRDYLAAVQGCGDRLLAARLAEDFHLDANRPDGCPICGAPAASVEWGRIALCVSCDEQARGCEQPFLGLCVVRHLGPGNYPVYLAVSAADGSAVVVKTPPVNSTPDMVTRLRREIEIMRRLDHPNILPLREARELQGRLCLVTNYVRGDTLRDLIKRRGALSTARAVGFVVQLLHALEHLHSRGFVHRDVKPANVLLVSRPDGSERVLLLDFNISRDYRNDAWDLDTFVPEPARLLPRIDLSRCFNELTMTGTVGGTPMFMAPEQITHYKQAQPSVDQYSVGITLYHLLTTNHALNLHGQISEWVPMILDTEPTPIQSYRPDLPLELVAIVHRTLRKDPSHRFPDVRALREALLPFCGREYDTPPPPIPVVERSRPNESLGFTNPTFDPVPSSPNEALGITNVTRPPQPRPPQSRPPRLRPGACPACVEPFTFVGNEPPPWPSPVCASCLTEARQNPQPVPGYLILRQFQDDGLTNTYLAWEQASDLPVALKTVAENQNEDSSRHRFRRQIEVLERLNHCGFLRVRQAGETEGRPYFTMDLIAGTSADDLLTAEERLAVPRVVGWMLQVLDALGHLHALGCIHRNVKPRHLLIANTGEREVVHLTGLDLVEVVGEQELGSIVGTIAFMSPEAGQAESVGPAVDQYAAAITLYNLLSGNLPYTGSSTMALLLQIVTAEPKPLSELRPDLPVSLVAVIHRAMHKDPQQRFRDVLEFRDALLPFAQ